MEPEVSKVKIWIYVVAVLKEEMLPPVWQWQPSSTSLWQKFPTGFGTEMETVSQTHPDTKLHPNYEDSIMTQHPRERERERMGRRGGSEKRQKEKIRSINLCPGAWFRRGHWITHYSLKWRQTHIVWIRPLTCAHIWLMAVPQSPVIKLHESFHRGDGGRGQTRRREGGGRRDVRDEGCTQVGER